MTSPLDWLVGPWSEPIMQRAFASIALLSIATGALGCWIVIYNLSYSAESLAHAIFPGLVLAALLGLPLLLGGAAGLAVAAIAVAVAGRAPEIGRDTAVTIVISTLFGAGVLLALSQATPPGLQGLMFGDLLGATDLDLVLSGSLAVVTSVVLAAMHWQLLAVGFDRSSASTLGARPLLADIVLLLLLAFAILVAVQALGNLLVIALLVGPASTAKLISRRLSTMLVVAPALSIVAGVIGLYLSYYAGTAAGASIVVVVVAVYLATLAVTRISGRARATRRGSPRPAHVRPAVQPDR